MNDKTPTNDTETKGTIKKFEDSVKITITKEAEVFLVKAIERINKGFEAGRVTRQVVSSWLLEKACGDLTDEDVRSIRGNNFNAVNALSILLKRVQETGKVPPELRQLLMNQVGLEPIIKKFSKTKLTNNSTNGGVETEGEVTNES